MTSEIASVTPAAASSTSLSDKRFSHQRRFKANYIDHLFIREKKELNFIVNLIRSPLYNKLLSKRGRFPDFINLTHLK